MNGERQVSTYAQQGEQGLNPDAVKAFFIDLNRIPPSDPRQIDEWCAMYKKQPSPDLKNKLIESQLRLVVFLAKRYQFQGGPTLMDLISVGYAKLHKAVDKFDPSLGATFSSYASNWIKAGIFEEIRTNYNRNVKWITTAKHRKIAINFGKIVKTIELEGKEATNEAIAERLNDPKITKEDIARFRIASFETESLVELDADIRGTGGYAFSEIIPNCDPPVIDAILNVRTIESLRALYGRFVEEVLAGNSRAIFIFNNRMLGDPPMSLAEIAKKFDLSRERIRQIETQIKKKLKEFLEGNNAQNLI